MVFCNPYSICKWKMGGEHFSMVDLGLIGGLKLLWGAKIKNVTEKIKVKLILAFKLIFYGSANQMCYQNQLVIISIYSKDLEY